MAALDQTELSAVPSDPANLASVGSIYSIPNNCYNWSLVGPWWISLRCRHLNFLLSTNIAHHSYLSVHQWYFHLSLLSHWEGCVGLVTFSVVLLVYIALALLSMRRGIPHRTPY
ncbi:hypothetical protein VTN00DRAFT_6330 [Thermoascus crustaceus]|uniref:uncharacterized protein n=1 Tax=Thermoascus crustaceus TaxID=5088 RepID=UPI0037433B87